MKKIIALCLILLSLFSITSCGKADMYIANDFSYFVMYDEKYIPIDIDVLLDFPQKYRPYNAIEYDNVYCENAAWRDPFVWISDLYYDVEIVSTPFDSTIICVNYFSRDVNYFYCLPDQYDLLNEHYSQIEWTEKLYIDNHRFQPKELPEDAIAELLSKPIYLGDKINIVYNSEVDFEIMPHRVWQIDSTGCFLKRFGTLLSWGGKVYFYRGHDLEISYIDTAIEEFEELPELEVSPEIAQKMLEINRTD